MARMPSSVLAKFPKRLHCTVKIPVGCLRANAMGVRIRAELTCGIDFDLGNSPREFTKEKVAGKTIVTTTTNGTRALQAASHARLALVASFLNLTATAEFIARQHLGNLLVICSGTFDEAALEDVLGAGALCDLIWGEFSGSAVSDAAFMARQLFQIAQRDLSSAASQSRNGRRLQAMPQLLDDVPFCLQRDIFNFTAALQSDGKIKIA